MGGDSVPRWGKKQWDRKEDSMIAILFLPWFSETRIVQVDLKLSVWLRRTVNFWSSCLHFLSAGIAGVYHYCLALLFK